MENRKATRTRLGSVLQQRWLITDADGVSNPTYEWRDVPRVEPEGSTE